MPQSVLVTGSSSGIGEACTLRLDKAGYRVFAGVRREQDATALRRRCSARLVPVVLDVTDSTAIANAVQVVSATVGEDGLYGLVNNAGIPMGGPFEFISLDDLRRVFEVNFFGAVAVTQAMLPLLRKALGRIINISSVSGLYSMPFVGPYSASKFALEAFSESLRVELRPWGMHVSIIEPGSVETPIWGKSQGILEDLSRRLPAEAQTLYSHMYDLEEEFEPHGIPPQNVAALIRRALRARRPRERYLIGEGLSFFGLFRMLPARMRDWIVARELTPPVPQFPESAPEPARIAPPI